jgi:ethanolaminephosphotransferase
MKDDNNISKLSKLAFGILIIIDKCSITSKYFAQICFSLTLINIFISKKEKMSKLFDTLLCLIIILHSDTNIIVIALIVFQLNLLSPLFCSLAPSVRPLAYIWLSKVCFFYLGNSNSLASIDVGAGYTGMESFSPGIVSTLLAIHTYSGPVLVIVAYVRQTDNLDSLYNCLFISLSAELSMFAVLASMLRYHLFVWTVFSPMLLYQGMHLLVITVLMSIVSVLHSL